MSSSGHESQPDYSTWSTSSLIERITDLERQLHSRTTQFNSPPTTTDCPVIPNHQVLPSNPPQCASDKPKPVEPAANTNDSLNKGTKRKGDPPAEDFTPAKQTTRSKTRDIDPSKYHTRFIALKFAYLGQRYNGFEHANGNTTPLPTIEEELWKALRKTRLIFPANPAAEGFAESAGPRSFQPYTVDWDGCDYSKAGRTDRGVSAFGQVIGIRVRSSRPKFHPRPPKVPQGGQIDYEAQAEVLKDTPPDKDWDDISDELPYVTLLNSVLPEDIRILAWCPRPPPGFDARFSCRERQYKYFFTQPAFTPTPGALGLERRAKAKNGAPGSKYREGWLNIDAMKEAAKHFEGRRDFRNFCTLDLTKQISVFERMIYRADIELVDPKTNPLGYIGQPGFRALENCPSQARTEPSETECPGTPQVYVFTLCGNAFLWHQVRHMMSILFLVGQGLESPSIVPELLDASKNPRKPGYEMASDAPLVLWDCVYPDENSGSREDSLDWIYIGDPRMVQARSSQRHGEFGNRGVVDELWAVWRKRKMDEILAGAMLDLVISKGDQSIVQDGRLQSSELEKSTKGDRIYQGGDGAKVTRRVPIMQLQKSETVEVRNAKWLASRPHKLPGKGQKYKERA